MKLEVKLGKLEEQETDLLVVNLFEGVKTPGGGTGAVDSALGNLLTQLIEEEGFKGETGETLIVHSLGRIPAKKVLIVGLGKKSDFNTEKIRRAAAGAVKAAKKYRCKTVATILHGAGEGKIDAKEAAYALATGTLLANYSFTKYQKEKAKEESSRKIEGLVIVDRNQKQISKAKAGIDWAEKIYPGVKLVRDLVNEPGLTVTPQRLVNEAEMIAEENPLVNCRVFDEKALQKMGANALLAVSRGSDEPAYLIHLTYTPQTQARKKVALVGKGLTFDSGGYSLKPSEFMATMKLDMAGGATVLGIFKALAQLKPDVEIHGIIPSSENLISGKAIKPGDIVTAMNGTTIEILNTDAEGRLILADALGYIEKMKWDLVIDFATLTGACVVALGEKIGGLFCNNDKLTQQIMEAANREGESLWPMPLYADYKEAIKSKVADLQNISKTKWGGAITAALFLEEFVPEKTPWAHLDIAGPANEENETLPYLPLGGTGFGVRTAIRLLMSL